MLDINKNLQPHCGEIGNMFSACKSTFAFGSSVHQLKSPNMAIGGICGRVVKVVDFKPLALTVVGSNLDRDFGFFSREEAIQLAYGTPVVLRRCPFVPEIMHGSKSWNVAIWPIMCRCEVKPKTQNKQKQTWLLDQP
jgi:hypothetical protein